jgi:hypothetical protein
MTRQGANRWWRQCPGCGRERRLAQGGPLMRDHNRWDSAAWLMVPCEGSGQPPTPHSAPDRTGEQLGTRQASALVRGAV